MGLMDKGILDGHEVVPVDDLLVWARWYENADRTVARTEITNVVSVSTVFLGINHNFYGGRPLWFETMVFGGRHHHDCHRRSTWDEAEACHAEIVALIKSEELQ